MSRMTPTSASAALEPIDWLSLETHDGPYESWPLRSRLYLRGEPTEQQVPGYVIEAQYRLGDRYLLITSLDCPFEETYRFLLLDRRLRLLSSRSRGVPYTAACLLMSAAPVAPARLRLRFDDHELLLTVHPRRTLRGLGTHLSFEPITAGARG